MKGIYFLLIAIVLVLSACNSDTEKQKEKNVEEVPPSLQKEDDSRVLVELSDKEVSELHIKTHKVVKAKQHLQIVSPGSVQAAPGYISLISAPVDGRVVSLHKNEGDQVYKGQVLMEIESLEFGRLVSEYLKANAEADFYQGKYERMLKLVEKKISSESELEQIKSDYKRAQAAEDAAISMLRAVGVSQKEIDKLKDKEDINPVLKITSPISGVINEHLVELGQSVKAYEKMASVINNKKVLIKAFISPEEGQYVSKGDAVIVGHRNNNRAPIKATVSTVNPSLDVNNRSVIANILVNTRDNWPLPGENVRLEIESSSPLDVITVPMDAITYDDNDAVVFVKHSNDKYEKRILDVTNGQGDYAIVLSGLKENEEVAISQVFSLKALARYEQFAD